MNARERAWHERQRHRFMRPDAERFLKPDWRDRKYWSVPPPEWAQYPVDVCLPPPDRHEEAKRLNALWREHFEAMRALIALKAELTRELKAGFRPDQPRMPAGNPDGGQWTSELGGTGLGGSLEVSASRRRLGSRPHGHHFVSHSIYSKLPLQEETRKVFDEAKTGRLHAQRHGNSKEHSEYNDEVRQHLRQFLAEKGIEPEQMTPDQAREFVTRIKRSTDPRIRSFNLRVYRREMMYWLRRGPRSFD